MSPPYRKFSAGFTLLELLMAVALATVVSLLGAGMLRLGLEGGRRAAEYMAYRETMRDVWRSLQHDWRRRLEREFGVDEGAPIFLHEGGWRIGYVCHGDAQTGFVLVRYRWQDKDVQTMKDREEWAAKRGEVLARDLTQCAFAFLEPPSGDLAPRWRADWREGLPPPRLIRLELATPRGALPPMIFAAGE